MSLILAELSRMTQAEDMVFLIPTWFHFGVAKFVCVCFIYLFFWKVNTTSDKRDAAFINVELIRNHIEAILLAHITTGIIIKQYFSVLSLR